MMKVEQTAVMQECARGSLQGTLTFPEVVRKLAQIGVERYHADYSRQEVTYYLPDGDSFVAALPHAAQATAAAFSASAVEAAIREIQRGEILYGEFVRKTMAAGCVGYFVQIAGRRALYFGRSGETHIELFPAAVVESSYPEAEQT